MKMKLWCSKQNEKKLRFKNTKQSILRNETMNKKTEII